MPKVTIVSTANNDHGRYPQRYFNECAEDVRNQTFDDYEWIVVHFGEERVSLPPDSLRTDFHLRGISVSAAFNIGMSAATTEWAMIVHLDDRYHPQCLQALMNGAEALPDMAAMCTGFTCIDGNGEPVEWLDSAQYRNRLRNWRKGRRRGNPIMLSGSLINVEKYHECGGMDERLIRSYDTDLWHRLWDYGEFAYLGQKYVSYRRHAGQTVNHTKPGD